MTPDMVRHLQMGFKGDNPELPNLTIRSGGTQCLMAMTVEIGDNDLAKKWDGTVDERRPSGTGILINLLSADPNSTKLESGKGGIIVQIVFLRGTEPTEASIFFKFPTVKTWEPPRDLYSLSDPSGIEGFGYKPEHHPFDALIVPGFINEWRTGGADILWFVVAEEEKETIVQKLKDLFAKCHR